MGKKDRHKTQAQRPVKSRLALIALIPAIAALVLYVNTFSHEYVLDDVSAITQNAVVQQGTEGIPTIWKTDYRYGYWSEPGSLYRPLALTLFALEWEQWPNDPRPAHVVNVLLFALSCTLLFLLVYQWFGRSDPWLPLIVSLLFAAHPIHTEVVANIKSADELLAFVFSALALMTLWRHLAARGSVFSLWIIPALVCFFLALMSKESVVTLLAVVPLLIWFFTDKTIKQNLVATSWLLIPLAAYLGIRASVLEGVKGNDIVPMIDNILVSAGGGERLATALKLCGMYLWKLVMPHPLSHDYSYNQVPLTTFGDPLVWLSVGAYIALIWIAFKLLRKKHPISFAILFFLLTISLYTNLVLTIGTHFGERLLFLPSLGFCLALGWLVWKWGARSGRFEVKKAALPLLAAAVALVGYSVKTYSRNAEWATEVALFEADVKNCPGSSRTHYRLGMAYMKQRALKTNDPAVKTAWLRKAVAELREAVRIYPGYADAQGELGLAYHRMALHDDAIKHYRLALEISPNHYTTLNNLGTLLFERGRFEQAIPYFEQALKAHPRYKDATGNLASAHAMMGQYEKAVYWFKKAIQLAPSEASYYYYLGITYNNMGDLTEGHRWLEQAYSMDPGLRPK